MKTWVRKTLSVGVLAAGALLFAPAAVQADTAQVSIDNNGIANGNQAYAPIQIPVNVCGNGVGAVIGVGVGLSGACVNGAAQDVDHWSKSSRKKESSRTEDTLQFSWGNDGIANGNQAYVPVQVPVNVCGNGVGAVIGVGVGISGICANGAAQDVDHKESKRTEDTAQVSSDNDGILNGNQIYVPIQVPINVCGNGVGVVGVGVGISGACVNGAAQDVDKGGNGNGNHYKKPVKNGDHGDYDMDAKGGDHGYYKKESLPLVGGLAGTLTGGLPTGGLPTAGDTSSLPVAGDLGSGVKTSKVNVAGVDPMGLVGALPTA
jgi:hypothetical protein